MSLQTLRTQLELPYRRETWITILQGCFESIERLLHPAEERELTESERAIATGLRQLGTVVLADGNRIALCEVDVAERVELIRHRVGLRQLVARCFIDDVTSHAVLAVFRQAGERAYRLTFAARTRRFEDGTLEVQTTETARRRFTYVLGDGEPRRTAAERLSALACRRQTSTMEDVIVAFDVEPVSKEFFRRYREHYTAFREHLLGTDAPVAIFDLPLDGLDEKARDRALRPVRDFVKRLLGRLVFLHFLQKKGWLGGAAGGADWTGGNPRFLRELFDAMVEGEKDHFHSSRLVPLFFDTLNTPRAGDLFTLTGTRVPYLNGGLFERDFGGVEQIDFPAALFDALLAFLGEYNFTIDENDPEDHEIGIDPEMLGHIFENLLEDNKDKGAYYTPKPVVQYMCQQSLVRTLAGHFPEDAAARAEIERFVRLKEPIDARQDSWLARHATRLAALIEGLRICDPAIGSGAFPIGLLQEIYWAKLVLNPGLDRAGAKRDIIQRSLHGVDLDAGAVEIARLRVWLALIVEEVSPVPLPNLDYQIMQGNSLLESFEGESLRGLGAPLPPRFARRRLGSEALELALDAGDETELAIPTPAQHDFAVQRDAYFACHDPAEKALRRAAIDAAVLAAVDARIALRRHELERKIAAWEARQKQNTRELRTYRPSSREQRDRRGWQVELDALAGKQERLRLLLSDPRRERPFFLWHLWFHDVLADPPDGRGGFDIVIANPPYVSAIDYKNAFGDEARDALKAGFETATGAWDLYILFFELSLRMLREDGVACLINPNKYLAAPYARGLRNHLLARGAIQELVDVSRIRAFRQVSVYPVITLFGRNAASQGAIRVLSPIEQREQDFDIRKFRERMIDARFLRLLPENIWGFLLSEHYAVLDGIIPRTRPLKDCGQVNATSTAAEADAYGRHFVDADSARWRLINTGLIERYESLWGRRRLIHQGRQLICPVLPATAPISDTRRDLYDTPKIVFAKMASLCEAFPDLAGEYASVNTNCFYAPRDGEPLQFFAAIFNSRMFMFLYELYFGALRMAGGDFQWGSPQLRLVPIPSAAPADQVTLTALVDRVLAAKRTGDEATATALEAEIDVQVFRLYGMTAEEISFINDAAINR